MSGETGIKRNGNHLNEMYTKVKELFKCDPQFAKELGGVYRPQILFKFEIPSSSFPISVEHDILGLKDKLLDRIPMKFLGKDEL